MLKTKKIKDSKIAIVFVSASAGELDWNLPILELLLRKGFYIKIIILKRNAYESIKQNKKVHNFISKKNKKIKIIFCGGYFIEKIDHLIYLAYRILIKLDLKKYFLNVSNFNLFNKIFEKIFSHNLPLSILNNKKKKYLFLSEFPSLRKPRDVWIRSNFDKSVFIYHPHSPHLHSEGLDKKYLDSININYKKRNFLLLGHPLDYLRFKKGNNGKEISKSDLEKVFIGHPRYSDKWLQYHKKKSKNFRLNLLNSKKKNISILILSRGYGNFINKDYHISLVKQTTKIVHTLIPNCTVFIKKHPRETKSYWDDLINNYPSFQITNEHMLDVASKVHFTITFWTSGAIDCYLLGVPVIEYYDPNKFPRGQVLENKIFTSIYRKLKIVSPANNEKELIKTLKNLIESNYKLHLNKPHPFYNKLLVRSNKWEKKIENILLSHNFINKKY